jgi:1,2-diacylglycerol 3-beta-glucosyltransferase
LILGIFQWFCRITLAISGLYGLYHAFVSIHMLGKIQSPQSRSKDVHRFIVLICAKNEERVIDQLLTSLKKQNYPPNAFDIFVVADNCTDQTADIARNFGATVFQRFDPMHKSKGYAMNWFFSQFMPVYAGYYDACVVFDADNIVDQEFLSAMNRQLNAGHLIATGYRTGKNPSSSWVAGCSSLFWLLQTRFLFTPRAKLNMPCCTVGGTGFMFDLSVLGERGWQTQSLCEDIEFTLNSIADGYFVAYAPDAIFYDEQPLTFGQSLKQRFRWAVGNLQIISVSTPRLYRALRSGQSNVLDALLYSLGVLITAITSIVWALQIVLNAVATKKWLNLPITVIVALVIGYSLIALIAWLTLFLEKKNWPGSWKAIMTFPFYVFSWSLINIVALFYRDTVWHDIPHTYRISTKV